MNALTANCSCQVLNIDYRETRTKQSNIRQFSTVKNNPK